MYKVMLVDDDIPILKYLSGLIQWRELGCEIVASASSSRKALRQFAELAPDILITDIGMAGMDGLELAQQLKERKPELRIIFLTFHEQFHYARRAVQLDADDFLIKNELTAEGLTASVSKAVALLAADRQRRQAVSYKQDIQKNKEVLKRTFFEELLTTNRFEELRRFGERIGIVWEHSHFAIALGTIDYAQFLKSYPLSDISLLLYAIRNIAEELVPGDDAAANAFVDADDRLVIVINFRPSLHRPITVSCDQYLNMVDHRIREFLKIGMVFAYSKGFAGMEGIKDTYRKLRESERHAFYEETRVRLMPEHTVAASSNGDPSEAWNEGWDRVVKAFVEDSKGALAQGTGIIAMRASTVKPVSALLLAKCAQAVRMLEMQGGYPEDKSFYDALQRCSRLGMLIGLLELRLAAIYESKQSRRNGKKLKLQQIDQYLSNHLSDQVSLVHLAEHLYMSPSYLSRYFKQETGENFTDYVHRFKMKTACDMLRSNQDNIELIAAKLGYVERTYFSKVFKKYVGVSPKDYR